MVNMGDDAETAKVADVCHDGVSPDGHGPA